VRTLGRAVEYHFSFVRVEFNFFLFSNYLTFRTRASGTRGTFSTGAGRGHVQSADGVDAASVSSSAMSPVAPALESCDVRFSALLGLVESLDFENFTVAFP
jgi:hypothetical protein